MIKNSNNDNNIDIKTVKSFSDEWSKFTQINLSESEAQIIFNKYFQIFPWVKLPREAIGFDMGCGTGRWAKIVSSRVGLLNCIDPSDALEVAKINLENRNNIVFYSASVNDKPLPDNSQDFGYSLGVLHHVPNTLSAIQCCVDMLKPSAPLLIYMYYNFDNRSFFYKLTWKLSELIRKLVSILPSKVKNIVTDIIALFIYFPLSKFSLIIEKLGFNVKNIPLSFYRNLSFYSMRTDSRDRFGTPLEKRFSRKEISNMMESCGLTNIIFSEFEPFWCACGIKK
jgi:SAM-dependent methyltransferase